MVSALCASSDGWRRTVSTTLVTSGTFFGQHGRGGGDRHAVQVPVR